MSPLRTRGLALLALTTAMAVFCRSPALARKPGGGGGGPSPAETNPAIVYVVDDSKGGDFIVVGSADLASEIRLTNPGNSSNLWHYAPKWSPDGSRIAFWEGSVGSRGPTRLFEVRPDGTGRRLVRDFGDVSPYSLRSDPVWSPTGMEIVFAGGNSPSLWSIDLATGTVREISYRALDGRISPDLDLETPGYQGMISFLDANGATGDNPPRWRIAPLEFDENGWILPVDPALASNWGPDGLAPGIWSPDAKRLAYTDFQIDPDNWWLVVQDLATGSKTPLGMTRSWHSTWSSDGAFLVYSVYSDLMIVPADGSTEPAKYTHTRSNTSVKSPEWNPRWDSVGPGGF